MNRLLTKKINLLLHLAKIDGQFADSERELLKSILREKGLQESYLHEHRQEVVNLDQIKEMPNKAELLFWVLKLIHADNHLHPSELAYSRIIARQLNFREEVVDHFTATKISTLSAFEKEVKTFQIASAQ
jgi:uncharacterized tellurite resistance protein B-like protein